MRHWLLAACLPLLLAACSRRTGPVPGGPQSKQAPASSRSTAAQPAQPTAARPALPPVTPEQAMLAQPAARRLPEDFEIGPLADRLGGSRAERLAQAAASRFLSGLSGGKVPGTEILPERRDELVRSLQYYLDRRLVPSRYRLGPLVELEDGGLRCRVRLFGGAAGSAPGSALGELYFGNADGNWYLTDVQVGLAALGAEAPRRAEKFVPSEAR